MKIQVILGSTRPGRLTEKLAKWVIDEAVRQPDLEVELLDLRDYPLPFFNEAKPTKALNGKYENEVAQRWNDKVGEADGYIILTPEYNHGYSAVLKNALDYVFYNWNDKPVAFISHGSAAGGARAVEQLRLVAIELQMVPIRESIMISNTWTALDENDKLKDETLTEKFEVMLKQLIRYAKWLKLMRSEA